jgi:regulatory protein
VFFIDPAHGTSPRKDSATLQAMTKSAPTAASLYEAALSYLSARAASRARLAAALERRVVRWARQAERAGAPADEIARDVAISRNAIDGVLERLVESGLVDDARFAQQRAGALTRAGKSRRAAVFDLTRHGIDETLAREAGARDAETELLAAVTFARRKRLGPFAREPAPTPSLRNRWLSAFARAGYSFDVATRALRLDRETAEEMSERLRPAGWR